jgi:hypothetical protein
VTSRGHDNVCFVARVVKKELGVNVSDWTVHRTLIRAGLSSRVRQKKPKLTPKHIRDHLDFAKRHQNWTMSDWKRVISSDERKIHHFNLDGQSWCWVCDGQLSSCV